MNDIRTQIGGNAAMSPSRQNCIWMDAGLISFRLCDRNLQCDQCPLDRALRQPASPSQTGSVTGRNEMMGEATDLLRDLRQLSFDPNAWYGRSFWYLTNAPSSTVELGLYEIAIKLLPEILEVMIPCCRSKLQRHQPVFCFTTAQGMLTLKSPLSGLITDVNDHLLQDLREHKKGLAGPVKLLTIQLDAEEAIERTWLRGKPAIEFLNRRHEAVLSRFAEFLNLHRAELGQTSNDGGVPIDQLETAVGPKRYFKILQELFAE